MIGKDESVTSREGLSSTKAGRAIMKEALFKSKGYRMFNQYRDQTIEQMYDFEERFVNDLLQAIKEDNNPNTTQEEFGSIVGTDQLALDPSITDTVKTRLTDRYTLQDRVRRILNSNFVKMTFPVFNALFDAANHADHTMKQDIVEGHILAIDLSEPMDRIVDKDEDQEFLDDYRLMIPYILRIAQEKIGREESPC